MRSTVLLFVLATLFVFAKANEPTLQQVLRKPQFKTLMKLMKDANLLGIVSNYRNTTFFAPNDEAFLRTAESVNCYAGNKNHKINCLLKKFTDRELAELLQYHVIPKRMGSFRVLRTGRFTSLNGKQFRRTALILVDLSPGTPNAALIVSKLNRKYKNGILHEISHVMIPFIKKFIDNDPCYALSSPAVGANGKFVSMNKIIKSYWRCPDAIRTINRCYVRPSRICNNVAARVPFTKNIKVGKAVAAFANCKFVADAFVNC